MLTDGTGLDDEGAITASPNGTRLEEFSGAGDGASPNGTGLGESFAAGDGASPSGTGLGESFGAGDCGTEGPVEIFTHSTSDVEVPFFCIICPSEQLLHGKHCCVPFCGWKRPKLQITHIRAS